MRARPARAPGRPQPRVRLAGRRRRAAGGVAGADRLGARSTRRAIDREVARAIESGEELYGVDEAVLDALAPDLIVTQSLCTVCAVSGGTVRALRRSRSRADGARARARRHRRDHREHPDRGPRGRRRRGGRRARRGAAGAGSTRSPQRSRDVRERPGVVVVEWLDPPFAAGHWVPEMVELAGGREAARPAARAVVPDDLGRRARRRSREVVVLAPCGFDAERDARAGGHRRRPRRSSPAPRRPRGPGLRRRRERVLLAARAARRRRRRAARARCCSRRRPDARRRRPTPRAVEPWTWPLAAGFSRPSSAAPATGRRSCGTR